MILPCRPFYPLLICLSLLTFSIAQKPSVNLDVWIVQDDLSFYGYSNSYCGRFNVVAYDQYQNLKWSVTDTSRDANYFRIYHFHFNKKTSELVVAGSNPIADDVSGVKDYRIYLIDTLGKIQKVFKQPLVSDFRKSFLPLNGFAVFNDSVYYFGMEVVRNAQSIVYSLDTRLNVLDSVFINNNIDGLLYSDKYGLLVQQYSGRLEGERWSPLKKLDTLITITPHFSQKLYSDSSDWYLSHTTLHQFYRKEAEWRNYSLDSLYQFIKHIEITDSSFYVLGIRKAETHYSIHEWLRPKFVLSASSKKINYKSQTGQTPILFSIKNNQVLLLNHNGFSGYELDAFPCDQWVSKSIINVGIDSVRYTILDSISYNDPGTGIKKFIPRYIFCAKLYNLSNESILVNTLSVNLKFSFNCGSSNFEFNTPTTLAPGQSKWTCDTFYFSSSLTYLELLCLSIGNLTGKIDTTFTNNTACISSVSNKNQAQEGEQIKLYPVPARDKLFILSDITFDQVQIVSFTGQNMATIKSKDIKAIDINNLPPGIYFLKLTKQGKIATNKFIKS